MKFIFTILFFVTTYSFSFSQVNDNHYHTEGIGTNLLSTGNTGTGSNIDVIYSRCNWLANPDDASKTLTGSITTYFKTISANVATISFDFNNASFNNSLFNVQYHGSNCVASFATTGNIDIINISLPTNLANSATIDSVTINYSGIPPGASGAAEGYQQSIDAAGNNYIYTLSESYEDKDWWPCKADMQDKIDSIDINVTVPNTFWVAANGAMIDSADDGTNRTFKFKHRYPIASYLVAIAIAKYDRYYLGTLPVGSKNVPFVVNMFKGKSSTTLSKILTSLNNNKLVFAQFNNLFGNYGFANEKHGYYEFGFGGGMEHQTFSGMGGGTIQSNTVLAHELAHQWWGDKVTFATWNHLWLAEGFATYSEALAFEFVPSIGISAVTKMLNNKTTARANNSTPILISNISNSNTVWTNNNTTAIYERGCMVASMLRCLLGDTKFFTACKNYLSDPVLAYKSAITADLQTHMQNQFGENMNNFFTEWITKRGTPDYTVEWGNIGKQINIKLTQTVTSTGTVGTASTFFPMPVVIKIADATGTIDTTVVIYHKAINQVAYAGNGIGATINNNAISYNLSFVPATLTFDELNQTMANGTINYSIALPINNIEISAEKYQNQNIISTNIYTNTDIQKVELEKSIDAIHFTTLNEMFKKQLNATWQSYQAFDEFNLNEKIYYRSKVYTLNNVAYSKIIAVENNPKLIVNISPNPVKNILHVNFNNYQNTTIKIELINVKGQLVKSIYTSKNNCQINTSNLANGIYSIKILSNNEILAVDKFIVEK